MKSFLAGVGIGAGVGLLLAPEAGLETRRKIKEKFGKSADKLNTSSQPIVSAVRDQVEQLANKEYEQPKQQLASAKNNESERVLDILNSASKTKLTSVPGIGDGIARSIIEHRPYSDASQVIEKTILSQEVLDKLKKQLIEEEEAA